MANWKPPPIICGQPRRNSTAKCLARVPKEGMRCHRHGAAAPAVKLKQRRTKLDDKAMELAATVVEKGLVAPRVTESGVNTSSSVTPLSPLREEPRPVLNPLQALLLLGEEVWDWKVLLAKKVEELAEYRYEDLKGGEQLRSEVRLFGEAMDRCGSLFERICRLDLEARLVRVTEQQASVVVGAVESALKKVGLEEPELSRAREAAIQYLRSQTGA